ncbi:MULTISPECIES: NADH-quinone oxidoreductase subunit J family protein [Niastella]|uniref:NADH-quinone oxidoreductase subunit J n=1 Tax=Niastella soli TaxID=2821487 RepID=A0ABS3YRU7_9BACT|nr:NADH-quinone oxidoreductase subunit J [Niastella soli]MBO9200641.1 NADH-quinone oxidoreductase subunit J [Niastella soli]
MSATQFIFYLISAFVLGTAVLAVTTRKIFRSAIWLLFSLVGVAGLYFWMQVEFVAAVQIIVYVGGVVVLIIFSIFLTHHSGGELPRPPLKRTIFSMLAVLFGFAFSYNLIAEYGFPTTVAEKPFVVSVSDIGEQMLDTRQYGYVLPFEVVSMLLLAAMIGCIVIAMRSIPQGKAIQKPATPMPANGGNIHSVVETKESMEEKTT